MAKVLKGVALANTEAKLEQFIKANYDSGQRSIVSQYPELKGRTTGAPTDNLYLANYWANKPQSQPATAGFWQKLPQQLLGVGQTVGEKFPGWVKTSATNMGKYINDAAMLPVRTFKNVQYQERTKEVDSFENGARQLYKTGRITKQEYLDRMNQAVEQRRQIAKDIQSFANSTVNSFTNARLRADGTIDWTESLIATIDGAMTAFSLASGAGAFKVGLGAIKKSAIEPSIRVGLGSVGVGNTMRATATTIEKTLVNRLAAVTDTIFSKVGGYQAIAEAGLNRLGTSPTAYQYMKNAIVEMAIRSPLRRENLRFTQETINAYKDGGYFSNGDKLGAVPNSVLMAATFASGGALGFITKNFAKGGKALREAMYGEPAFFDMLNDALVARNVTGNIMPAIRKLLEISDKKLVKNIEGSLKQIQDYVLQGRGMATAANAVADAIVSKLMTGGRTIPLTMDEVVEDMFKWHYAQNLLDDLNKKLAITGGYAAVIKYDQATGATLAATIGDAFKARRRDIESLATHQERMALRKAIAREIVLKQVARGDYWTNNSDIVNTILDAIERASSYRAVINAPKVVNAAKLARLSNKALPAKLKNELARLGYAVQVSENISRRMKSVDEVSDVVLKSKYVPVDDTLFRAAAQSKPYFRSVGAILSRAGLGIDDTTSIAYTIVRNDATRRLDAIFGEKRGAGVLNALQQYVENRGIMFTGTDIRMLRLSEIQDAIGAMTVNGRRSISKEQAKLVRNALLQAHLAAPIEVTGLANKMIDKWYQVNPLYRYYSRAQGALRYTWNPFFRVQEIVETEMLGQALANGKKPWLAGFGVLAGKTKQQLDEVVTRMEQAGFFHDGMMATRYGEAAQDVFIGRMSTQILQSQKRSLAGVVIKMAQKYKMPIEELLQKHPQDVIDMIRPIVQYPTNGVLNSNLAKALNVAVFPARYNLKVTMLATKALSQQPASVQLAVINGLWGLDDWLKSPEGLQWQRDNAEAIGVFRWLTPLGSIQWVADVLSTPFGKSDIEKPFDFGLIGGLPFGVISQIIQSQGFVDLNSPYVAPEKAEIYSRYIPESLKARAASALTDLLGSVFTYPGRIVGLPGKGQLLRDMAQIPFPNESSEWNKKIYAADELPEFSKYRQQVWRDAYLKEIGVEVGDMTPEIMQQRLLNGTYFKTAELKPGISDKVALNDLKQAAKKAKAKQSAAKKAADKVMPNEPRTGTKKAVFPGNLPQ